MTDAAEVVEVVGATAGEWGGKEMEPARRLPEPEQRLLVGACMGTDQARLGHLKSVATYSAQTVPGTYLGFPGGNCDCRRLIRNLGRRARSIDRVLGVFLLRLGRVR